MTSFIHYWHQIGQHIFILVLCKMITFSLIRSDMQRFIIFLFVNRVRTTLFHITIGRLSRWFFFSFFFVSKFTCTSTLTRFHSRNGNLSQNIRINLLRNLVVVICHFLTFQLTRPWFLWTPYRCVDNMLIQIASLKLKEENQTLVIRLEFDSDQCGAN